MQHIFVLQKKKRLLYVPANDEEGDLVVSPPVYNMMKPSVSQNVSCNMVLFVEETQYLKKTRLRRFLHSLLQIYFFSNVLDYFLTCSDFDQ